MEQLEQLITKFRSYSLEQRIFGLIFLLVAIATASWFLLLSPLRDKHKSIVNNTKALSQEKVDLDNQKVEKSQLLEKKTLYENQLLLAEEKLPADAEIPMLLQRIHNQAKITGLEIGKFGRLSDVAKERHVEIPVEMNMRGKFDDLVNFIYYLSRMTLIVNIRNIDIKAKDKASESFKSASDLEISALLTTFRFKNPEDNK